MTTTAPYPRLDPDALKVLAHPLRSRLLGELRLNGPATAT
ncbi:MAG: ArsR family transcriptional regulator, partial [Acidimicrobiia bacterium]